MNIIDLVYFLSYKAYSRNDDSKFGVFFLLAFWMSFLQIVIIFNMILIFGLSTGIYIIEHVDKSIYTVIYFLLCAINNLYVYTGNRKARILSKFDYLGEKKEKRYWWILVAFFITIWVLLIMFSIMNKNLQGI